LVTLDRILNRITGVTSGCWWLVVVNAIPISDICQINQQNISSYSVIIVIYGISGLFKILPTRGICNLRGLARVGYYLEWVVLNNPRMPYNVLSNIPKFLDNDIIDEILLPMGYER
jgi:hypothetical protein